jgi:uncharacterized protein
MLLFVIALPAASWIYAAIGMRPSLFPVAWFFLLVLALQILPQGWHYLGAPSLIGLLLILWLRGLPGIREVIYKLMPWSAGRAWPMFIVCLSLPLLCPLLTLALFALAGGPVPPVSTSDLSTYLYTAVIDKGFFGPGIIEEFGWRGFALPYLQRRHSALASSLIIGLVWALWHVPAFIAEDRFVWWSLAIFMPQVIGYSILFTWVYNTTGGNLLACVLLHGALNAEHHFSTWYALPDTARTQLLVELPSFCIAIGLLWLYGPSNLSRSPRVMAPPCSSASGG